MKRFKTKGGWMCNYLLESGNASSWPGFRGRSKVREVRDGSTGHRFKMSLVIYIVQARCDLLWEEQKALRCMGVLIMDGGSRSRLADLTGTGIGVTSPSSCVTVLVTEWLLHPSQLLLFSTQMITMLKEIRVNSSYPPLSLILDVSLLLHTNYDYPNISNLACVAETLQFGTKRTDLPFVPEPSYWNIGYRKRDFSP